MIFLKRHDRKSYYSKTTNKGGSRRPEKSRKGWLFLVFPFMVFEKSVVVAAMAAWAEAVLGHG